MVRPLILEKTTDRLLIRPYFIHDYSNWFASYESCSEAKNEFDEGKVDMSDFTPSWFDKMVKTQQRSMEHDDAYILGVFKESDGSHIGVVDISTLLRDGFQWGRIGYNVLNPYWRKGYGKEAVKGALELAFLQLGFHRIEAHIHPNNDSSIRLAEAVGMKYECVRKGFTLHDGKWTDHLIYYKSDT
ncbi:GNAT family N-acetyltransferase [Fictibacillus fluitans]|uniref:GNAT family N-acetyltransferase n=1 Tax=Fictibacillus fluitans TaxID=3058422 RepID=A0ABT8HZV3_9BACL|nr:GNAT family N-acetyltransferase [Fictibacillus sp. NE201]MDN4525812.1 GNAT family N-acetyltransferase [Fictibacillus sp. NE201]